MLSHFPCGWRWMETKVRGNMGRIRNTSKMLQTKGWLDWFENLCWCSVTLETFFVFLLQYFTSGINWKLARFFPQYFMPGISWKLARFLLLNQSNKKLETPSPWRRLSGFLRCAALVFLKHVYSCTRVLDTCVLMYSCTHALVFLKHVYSALKTKVYCNRFLMEIRLYCV